MTQVDQKTLDCDTIEEISKERRKFQRTAKIPKNGENSKKRLDNSSLLLLASATPDDNETLIYWRPRCFACRWPRY